MAVLRFGGVPHVNLFQQAVIPHVEFLQIRIAVCAATVPDLEFLELYGHGKNPHSRL